MAVSRGWALPDRSVPAPRRRAAGGRAGTTTTRLAGLALPHWCWRADAFGLLLLGCCFWAGGSAGRRAAPAAGRPIPGLQQALRALGRQIAPRPAFPRLTIAAASARPCQAARPAPLPAWVGPFRSQRPFGLMDVVSQSALRLRALLGSDGEAAPVIRSGARRASAGQRGEQDLSRVRQAPSLQVAAGGAAWPRFCPQRPSCSCRAAPPASAPQPGPSMQLGWAGSLRVPIRRASARRPQAPCCALRFVTPCSVTRDL